MKTKKKEFIQYLFHEIENEEEVEKFVESSILPSIGYVVMYFNALEKALDNIICQLISDRTDSPGLIIIHKMTYSSKVDLFKRFCDDLHSSIDLSIESYDELINDLKESGRLRNLVVHAGWENTDDDNYTYINLRISKNGMHQEYVQFSERSLTKIILLIMGTRNSLFNYWDERNEQLNSI